MEASVATAFDEVYAYVTRYHPKLEKKAFRKHFDATLRLAVEAELRGVAQYITRQQRFRETLRRLGYPDNVLADRLAEMYGTLRLTSLALYPDAAPVLETLAQRHVLGLITNGPAAVQRAQIQALGLEAYFPHILVSEEVGHAKPHPAIFRRALELAEVTPQESLFIGDTPETDMVGAQQVGIQSAWLNRDGRRWPEGLPPPHYTITSLTQLSDLV